ncbi:MAG: MerR family transcriptional regulator [Clostridia bacterium]|nr:MerR family transcriptional regulator [Clostridia bacterium]
MSYSIGDVSRVLGMTTSALHFYEKEGIIDTPKEESGRRYYEDADVNRLISAKKYRAMGVPLRDIAKQFSRDGMTGEQVLSRMRERRAEADRLCAQYAALSRDIGRLIELGEQGLGAKETADIRPAEDMLLFQAGSGGFVPRDKAEQRIAQRWLEAMPAVSVGIVQEQGKSAAFALMLPAHRAEEIGFEEDGRNVRRIPGGMALHAVVHCGEEQYETPEVIFRPIHAYAREHRFEPRGAIYGSVLFVDCSGGVRKHFYDTYMVLA